MLQRSPVQYPVLEENKISVWSFSEVSDKTEMQKEKIFLSQLILIVISYPCTVLLPFMRVLRSNFSYFTFIFCHFHLLFCLIWFFMSHQQSFSYKGTGLPGLMFLLKDTTKWRPWGSNPRPFGLESSTLPLGSHLLLSFRRCCIAHLEKVKSINECMHTFKLPVGHQVGQHSLCNVHWDLNCYLSIV